MPTLDNPGPVAADATFVDRLRDVLLGAGYTVAGVAEVLPAVRSGLRRQDLPLYDRQVRGGDALTTLVRLFLLGLPVAEDDARRALAPLDPGELQRAFLLRLDGGWATSLTQLLCIGELLILGDRDDALFDQPGWVTASSPTARVLEFLTVRQHVATALDLGCGSGMQALVAASHSEHVTAVDLNPRAISFTRFNALLNRHGNVEARQGSWFDPVAGDRFDLIVSNPPFVVSPDSDLLFRDSPMPGDEVSRMIVSESVAHLNEDGFAHVLSNWAVREGEAWDEPPRRWLAGLGCDAVLLHFGTDDPLSYAATWNGPLRQRDPAAFSAALDRWTEYYRDEGITALCAGALVLRRRTAGANWVRALRLPRRPEEAAGDDLLRMFGAEDFVAALPGPDGLLDTSLRIVDRHEVRQLLTHRRGVYDRQVCTITATSGLGLGVDVDPEVLQVLLRLDSGATVREVASRLAGEMGFDEAELLHKTAEATSHLLRHGLVVLPGSVDNGATGT